MDVDIRTFLEVSEMDGLREAVSIVFEHVLAASSQSMLDQLRTVLVLRNHTHSNKTVIRHADRMTATLISSVRLHFHVSTSGPPRQYTS